MNGAVLVTGGAGYIGSHAVAHLIKAGEKVVILDNLSRGYRSLIHPMAIFVEGDTRNTKLAEKIMREHKIASILHFAAFTSVAESVISPEVYYDNNFGGTVSLLEAAKDSGVRRFVFSLTAAVYSDPGQAKVLETSQTRPPTAYGQSKLMSEEVIRDVSAAHGMDFVLFRYFNVAGASLSGEYGQFGDNHGALVKRAALAAVGKVPRLEIFGTDYSTVDGTAVRDYIHVEDLADLHVRALGYLQKGGASDLFNCGYSSGFSVRQVINAMKGVSGVDFEVVESPRRPGDLAQVVAETGKLQAAFQWKPQHQDLEFICRSAYLWEKRQLQG